MGQNVCSVESEPDAGLSRTFRNVPISSAVWLRSRSKETHVADKGLDVRASKSSFNALFLANCTEESDLCFDVRVLDRPGCSAAAQWARL